MRIITVLVLLMLAVVAQAETHYRVDLLAVDGQRLSIATLSVSSFDRNDGYRLELEEGAFSHEFLSMRPFRCLTVQGVMLCYVEYPYVNQRKISRQDLTDLEYDLLFIARTEKEYGIDPWNGRYFKLRWQGASIVGELNEVDLNILASPPEGGSLRPIVNDDLSPAAGTVGLLQIVIEPMAD